MSRRRPRRRAGDRRTAAVRVAAAALACAAWLAACGGALQGDAAGPARVVLVTVDTLRADHVGSYRDGAAGSASPTPVLDGLAREGTRFAAAVSPTPLTLPSHATLLTGLEPYEHGVHHNGFFRLPASVPTLAERMRASGRATAAFVSAFVLSRRFGLDRGFDVYDTRMELTGGLAMTVAERRGDRTVDAALAWLADAPERFFLWVHLYDPHAVYTPPHPFDARFADDPYTGEVAFADAQVGRLVEALDARFGAGGTLVVVTSDHGESLGEHDEPTHSYGVYEATQHVPLLLRGPGVPAGQVVEDVVTLADVPVTLVELAGLEPLAPGAGVSLVDALGGARRPDAAAWVQTVATRFDQGWSPLWGLRTADRKYIRGPQPELYDLTADPGELRNLAPERPAEVARLDARLAEWIEGAPPVEPNVTDLDEGERERLRALGYVAEEDGARERFAVGWVGGPDPRTQVAVMEVMNRANGLLAQGRHDEALELVEGLPETGWLLALRALALVRADRAEEAAPVAERLIALEPHDSNGYELLGNVHEESGRPDEAERLYREAHALEPSRGSPLAALGRLAEARGERAEARRLYREALEADNPDAGAAWRLAAFLLEDGEVAEASALLAQVPAPTLAEELAALRLAHAELAAGRPEMGLLRADAGLRGAPDSEGLLQVKAVLLDELGRPGAALSVRRRALRANPENPMLKNDLAWSLAMRGRELDRALELARQAVAALPDRPEARDTLAAVHLARGEPEAALAQVERALPQASGTVRAQLRLHRAQAWARLGRRDDARGEFDDALAELGPEPPPGPVARLARRVEAELRG